MVGQVEGFEQAGVLSAAKHFPGHGDTATDSHLGLAKVTHSRAKMARIDLPPFQDAIDAAVPAIMVAHVTVPAYDRRPPPCPSGSSPVYCASAWDSEVWS